MAGFLIEARDISKNFGAIHALENVSFNMEEGEIVGLIGSNGAGKTTLFNIIMNIIDPDSGTLLFGGEKLMGLSPQEVCRRGVVKTFQQARPFPNMTVMENIVVGALYGGRKVRNRAEARKEAERLLQFAEMGDKAGMIAKNLTLVDKKKTEMLRALATWPKLLLIDETLAGLNPSEVADAVTLIKRIRSELNVTILMIEHLMRAIMSISDRVIVLHHGEKIAEGKPVDIANDTKVIEAYLGEKLES